MKILILALSGNGDALMFTPAIERIKEIEPNCEIDALAMFKGVKDFYERNPLISKVHYFDFLNSNPLKALSHVLGFRGKYDASFNVYPSNRWEYNLISFLIGAKKRAGVNYLRANKTNLSFLNNVRITEDDSLHNVEENIKLVETLFNTEKGESTGLRFPLSKTDNDFATEFLSSNNIEDNDTVIGIHAGCQTLKNHINRRWAPEKFAQLANKLEKEIGCKILIFGGPDEDELKQNIITMAKAKNIINVKTKSIAQSTALIKRCNLFITNDSGLMHIAAAMQRKTLAIIGPTNLNYIRPWKTEHEIATLNLECSPCFFYSPKPLNCSRTDIKYKCIKEISVEMVFDKSIKMLNN